MKTARDQVLSILRDKLDGSTVKIIESALTDSARLEVIRDAFLEGRDVEAVQLIRELDPIGIRRILPCHADLIPDGATAQITSRPQIPFQIDRFVVSPSCASAFDIVDICMANRSQFIQSGLVAADLFASTLDQALVGEPDADGFYTIRVGASIEARLGLALSMPLCPAATDIVVTVVNIDLAPRPFRAAFLGTTKGYG